MTRTTVNRGENGQYKVTIPRDLGDAFDLDGKRLEWKAVDGDVLEVEIYDR